MRRPIYRGEALVNRTVDDLVRKFQYPVNPESGSVTVLGGGGAPTVVMAASNSSALSQAKADVQCTGGGGDLTFFQQAIDLLPSSGGRVLVAEGLYEVTIPDATYAIDVPDAVTFEGMGHALGGASNQNLGAAISQWNGSDPGAGSYLFNLGNGATLKNLFLQTYDSARTVLASAVDVRLQDCYFSTDGFAAVVFASAGGWLHHCWLYDTASSPTDAIVIVDTSTEGLWIEHNYMQGGANAVNLDSSERVWVNANLSLEALEHGFLVNACDEVRLRGNWVESAGQLTDDTYDGIHISGTSNAVQAIVNTVLPAPNTLNLTRYGLNISAAGVGNAIAYANELGDSSEYGTGDYNDSGTNTRTAPGGNGQFSY